MAVALLDVNVLVALAWPRHVHHAPAQQWFSSRRSQGWATCPLTQLAFVRLSAQPAVVNTIVSVSEALQILEANTSTPEHKFWPLDYGLNLLPEIRARLMGHQQQTDAVLLDLAIRRGGKLATFDRRLENLLAPGSPHGSALEILPID